MYRTTSHATWFVCAALVCAAFAVLSCGGNASNAAGPGASGEAYSLSQLDHQVFINGAALDQRQLAEFQQRYGQGPRPGRYWYDSRSGLFGNEGGPSLGWIYPGHEFGALSADASRGTTGVFVNGRQIDTTDYMALAAIVGVIAPGRYWLDGMGNYGYEDYPVAVGNLYQLMQWQTARSGGDNAWSTRFSSGNSTNDNSAGYVQCPDGTFVSYGM